MIKKHFYTVLFSLFSLFVVCRQPANEDLLIRPGDTLTIEVKQMRSFNKKYLVNSQGVIALRKWGELYVDGLTVEDAQEKVINFFAKKRIDRNAEVKIQLIKVASSSKIQEQANAGDNINPKNVVNVSRDKVEPVYQKSEGVIHITGAVKKIAPQVYRPELALSDALHQAGITSESKIDAIEIISTKGEKKTIAFHCEQPKGSTSNPYLQIGDLVRIPNISEKSQQKKLFEVLPISQDEIIEISPTSKPQALIDIQVEKEEEVVDDVQMITPRIQPTDTPMPISAKHEISKSADDQYLEQIVDKPSGISGEDLENSVQNNFNNHQANTFYVLGAVHQPGEVQYEEGMTVAKAIKLASGLTEMSSKTVRIEKNGILKSVTDLATLPHTQAVSAGDVIVAERVVQHKYIVVMGHIKKPLLIELKQPLTLNEVAELCGGLKSSVPGKATIVRFNSEKTQKLEVKPSHFQSTLVQAEDRITFWPPEMRKKRAAGFATVLSLLGAGILMR